MKTTIRAPLILLFTTVASVAAVPAASAEAPAPGQSGHSP